jgi:hypothetical protein
MSHSFPSDVARKLKTYVYRLIDPRNGETFYVGKGKRDRVFQHVRGAIESDDPSDKLNRIREIIAAGFSVNHVIHRHGLDDATAFEVEAALIDAYPGLTNVSSGAGSNDFGAMHADEIIRRYEAAEAVFVHRVIMINVTLSATEQSLYDATRYAWKISVRRAKRAEIILAVRHGVIIAAFIPDTWLPASPDHFPGREPVPGRYGFVGSPATDDISLQYVGKRVPDRFRKQGAANPIRYTYS